MTRWHPDEQAFLIKLEQQCNEYYQHHNKDHIYYTKLSSRFNIPILIVSAVNALTAVGLNSFISQEYVSVLNAILSSGTGVLGSIQLYMKINEKMTNALRASILMKRLALKVSKELSIDPENRVTDGQAFLSDCFSEFNTALEQGNPIEKSLSNFMAFTAAVKKEKLSLMNLAATAVGSITGSPKRSVTDLTRLPESSVHRGEPRAKKLWGLVDKVRTAEHSLPGSSSPGDRTGSSPGASTPEELGSKLVVPGSAASQPQTQRQDPGRDSLDSQDLERGPNNVHTLPWSQVLHNIPSRVLTQPPEGREAS